MIDVNASSASLLRVVDDVLRLPYPDLASNNGYERSHGSASSWTWYSNDCTQTGCVKADNAKAVLTVASSKSIRLP